jgi:uncharacterized membrane protein (DUF4010 family)
MAIIVAVASNTLVKCGLAAAVGSRALAARVAVGTVAVCLAGIGTALVS